MVLTKEQFIEFEKASKPLIEYLNKYHHPHVIVIVENDSTEIFESSGKIVNKEFIKN